MQKKSTRDNHVKIANEMMAYIYNYIDTSINIDELAARFGVSKFHLHKLFKEQMGVNIYETIKSIRLQKASNLLLTNHYSTITEVANMCGYSSQTSFIRAFKERFEMTPKQWRRGGYEVYSKKILENSLLPERRLPTFDASSVKIIKAQARKIYYIRQHGYFLEEGKRKWQKLKAWVYTNELKEYEEIGVYHDNPAITPHESCSYVAAICPKEEVDLSKTNLPSNTIPEGLYATFDLQSEIAELGWFTQWVYHEWLPKSGFETTTHPSFAVMRKNHILDDKGGIDATYYLPIRYA